MRPGGDEGPDPGGHGNRARRWDELAARAHEPWAQEELRRGIHAGEIRVAPAPGGGVRIVRSPKGQDRT